jgi:hypothetical protein
METKKAWFRPEVVRLENPEELLDLFARLARKQRDDPSDTRLDMLSRVARKLRLELSSEFLDLLARNAREQAAIPVKRTK